MIMIIIIIIIMIITTTTTVIPRKSGGVFQLQIRTFLVQILLMISAKL